MTFLLEVNPRLAPLVQIVVLLQDLRYAVRSLSRSKSFTTTTNCGKELEGPLEVARR